MTDPRIHGPIGEAYAAYHRDPRVTEPNEFEAFADAVEGYRKALLEDLRVNAQLNRDELNDGSSNEMFWDRLSRLLQEIIDGKYL